MRSPLRFGSRDALRVRRERIHAGCRRRILYASDLHLNGRRAHLVDQITEAAGRSRPDVVLLGGDLVDVSGGLDLLRRLTRELSAHVEVWAIAGNHDRLVGAERVRDAIEDGGGGWLGDRRVVLRGTPDVEIGGAARDPDADGRFRVLCAHDPSVFRRAAERGYHLVLAGHLHGGQVVLWRRGTRLYPGALFYRWNGLRFRRGHTTMLVSRGVADTLPIRWRCPRELLLVELT